MKKGMQTWVFDNKPVIISSATVAGPLEAKGPIAQDFDRLYKDSWLGQDSFEKAERKMLEDACQLAVQKANLKNRDIQFFLCGDLLNQIISSGFTARTMGIPFLGLYGACSTSMESLALGALLVSSGFGNNVLCGTVSHNSTAEKQYRYPTEYGVQKPPTSQCTVTGAGVALLASNGQGPRVTSATLGKIVDLGMTDPNNMGGAMAPAAVDTIITHLNDMGINAGYYDLIATGDLGKIGHKIAVDLFKEKGVEIPDGKFADCGMMIYDLKKQTEVQSGGSGCACCATVTFGHILNRIKKGELKKVLIVATGALLSPISYQQNESIPCIAHAVAIEGA